MDESRGRCLLRLSKEVMAATESICVCHRLAEWIRTLSDTDKVECIEGLREVDANVLGFAD